MNKDAFISTALDMSLITDKDSSKNAGGGGGSLLTLTNDSISRLKKYKLGRIAKQKGDFCLLAGSPRDALLQ
jgi:hypothetical protein